MTSLRERGEILLEIEMDKAILPVESNCTGTLLQILADVGQRVPVGAPIALYEAALEG